MRDWAKYFTGIRDFADHFYRDASIFKNDCIFGENMPVFGHCGGSRIPRMVDVIHGDFSSSFLTP